MTLNEQFAVIIAIVLVVMVITGLLILWDLQSQEEFEQKMKQMEEEKQHSLNKYPAGGLYPSWPAAKEIKVTDPETIKYE